MRKGRSSFGSWPACGKDNPIYTECVVGEQNVENTLVGISPDSTVVTQGGKSCTFWITVWPFQRTGRILSVHSSK